MIYESEEGLMSGGIPKRGIIVLFAFVSIFIFFFLYLIYNFFVGPLRFQNPKQYGDKSGILITISEGESAKDIGKSLEESGVITSASVFSYSSRILGYSKKFVQGTYLFEHPNGILYAESKISRGDFGIEAVKITIPEGFTLGQVEDRLSANLPLFDKSSFFNLASTSEGYIFPETYFIMPGTENAKILKMFKDMFKIKTDKILNASSTANTEDVVKMASVLEKEVRDPEDMKIVSGILWKRMSIGMPLQVDSAPVTYERKGLPDNPICNPGLNAIVGALNPEKSPYLYFLTDKDGKVYYAKTFEEHKKNKAKYL